MTDLGCVWFLTFCWGSRWMQNWVFDGLPRFYIFLHSTSLVMGSSFRVLVRTRQRTWLGSTGHDPEGSTFLKLLHQVTLHIYLESKRKCTWELCGTLHRFYFHARFWVLLSLTSQFRTNVQNVLRQNLPNSSDSVDRSKYPLTSIFTSTFAQLSCCNFYVSKVI